MITAVKQPATQKPEVGMKLPIDTPLKLQIRPLDYKRGTQELIRRVKVYSRDSHYNPPQTTLKDGLDAWARHAAASNGFGDPI